MHGSKVNSMDLPEEASKDVMAKTGLFLTEVLHKGGVPPGLSGERGGLDAFGFSVCVGVVLELPEEAWLTYGVVGFPLFEFRMIECLVHYPEVGDDM